MRTNDAELVVKGILALGFIATYVAYTVKVFQCMNKYLGS